MTVVPAVPLDYHPPAAARRRTPAWAVVAAGVVVAVMVFVSYRQVRKPTAQLGDFGAYYRAGQAVAAGRSPYTLDPHFGALGAYMYCPAFAHVVCRPLAHLRYVWAMRAFLTLNWAATVGVVALSLRLAGRPGFWAGGIACLAVGGYLWSDLHNGQVGTLLLLACLGWIVLTLSGRPVLGGVSLSLAVGLKLYPMLLGPYLLLRRQWWPGLIGLAIGLAVQLALPAVFVGPRATLPLHREWIRFCLKTQVPEQTYRAGNESLLGVLARMPGVTDGWHVASPARLAALEKVYPGIVLVGTLAVYGWIVSRRIDPPRAAAVLLVWMTIAAPRAWTFNLAAELPAAVLLAAVALQRPRWWVILALVGPVYALSFPTNRLPLPARWTAGTQFLYDKHFVAAAVLAGAVVALRPPRPSPAAA